MTELIQALRTSGDEFVAAAQSVPAVSCKTKPGPDRWSVLECVEHIVITEGRFLSWLENPQPTPAPPINKEKEAMLAARMPSRVEKREAPETALPAGQFAELDEALRAFKSARQRTLQFAEEKGEALYSIAVKHRIFGDLNGMELMWIVDGHCRRHMAQILEAKSELASGI